MPYKNGTLDGDNVGMSDSQPPLSIDALVQGTEGVELKWSANSL